MFHLKWILVVLPLTLGAQDDFERFNAKPENVEVNDAVEDEAPERPDDIQVQVNGKQKSVAPSNNSAAKSRTRRSRRRERPNNFRAKETNKMTGQEEKVFGRETIQASKKKDKKYFNLNPETAFGPEIIKSFDFPNSTVLEITKFMQKQTGINLILGDDIKGKGKISISAPTPITVGDAWKAYLVALNMAGYSLIKTGQFYRIINSRDIRYTPTKIYTGDFTPDVENYMMKIIALKHVDASEIVRNFRPFMSRYGRILDIKQTNTIIITDTGTNINRLMKLVSFLDVPGYDESMHIIPVTNTSAQELAKLLDSILKDDKASSSRSSRRKSSSKSDSSTGANISKIIAEPRTNSIIAMANKSGAEQLRSLIGKLDVKTVANGSGKIQVYYLQYGDAENLAQTLTSLISNTKSASTKRTSSRSSRSRSSAASSSTGSIFNEEVKITADKATNSVVVTASPTDWLTVKSVIKKLDIPRDQVYVEGLIVETSANVNKQFGVSYAGVTGKGIADRVGFNAADLSPLVTNPLGIESGLFGGIGIGGTRTVDGPSGDITISPINALVKAAATDADTNVLATPQLLVLDNTEGTFEVGSEIPILSTNTATGGTQTQDVKFQDVTMKIKITPQINKVTRFVKMKIDQSIKDFQPNSAVTTSSGGVATDVRNAVTEVVVRDGDTIAMGGLLRNKVTEINSKVPLLGDIPVLGWLFKSKKKTKEKTNVLFFLSPKILSPYQRVAAQNTIDALDERENAIKKLNKQDLLADEMAKLRDKLEKQKEGPLYDSEQARLYENKDDGIGNDSLTIDDVKENELESDGGIPDDIEFEL